MTDKDENVEPNENVEPAIDETKIELVSLGDPLAYAVRQRRLSGGLTQEELQQFGGPGEVTVRNIENGKASPSLNTLAKLDKALRWPPGLAAEIAEKAPRRGSLGELLEIATDPETARQRPDRIVRIGGEKTMPPQLEHAVRATSLRSLSFDDLWRQWSDLFLESLAIEMEYGRRRGLLQPAQARQELWGAFSDSQRIADGSQWQPPWVDAEDHEEEVVGNAEHPAPMNEAGETPAADDGNVHEFRGRLVSRETWDEDAATFSERAVASENEALEEEGIAQLENP